MGTEAKTEDRRHLRSALTRQKLLASAKKVFLEEGFQKATISQMINDAKIGYGTAYVHFQGKEDLLRVLMENVMEQFYEIAAISFTPQTKEEALRTIRHQTLAFLKMAEAERNMMRIFEQAIGVSTVIADKWKAIREQFIESIACDIAYSQQHGLARKDLNHLLVARGWFYMNEMYLWEIVRDEQQSTVEEIAATITELYTTGLYL
ncbi:TetR/AcrR family transcriptional regulator [Paenibacillus montanisoli]|uniref:TetR/AcrR family transcriptional regulator n=1 Tax=Paenibacillus montanisoli TaxID=2081970 RepID=A0A328TWI0_9BACL|nr:TetR/AcrR family transcriptional regulator [Paenibacillus montanisoli]RAP74720.1 TetR/AcrR family transcriptional regulator [Paenibacillus montanisoli]